MSFNLRDGNDVALPMLLVVLILGYGIFTTEPPLASKRQAATASAVAVSAQSQEIPSRLWQDPLVGIADAAKERWEGAREPPLLWEQGKKLESPDWDEMFKTVNSIALSYLKQQAESGTVHVMPVFIRGGRFDEDAEQRRRSRYAVVSGLSEAGFVPANAEALGVLVLPPALWDTRYLQTLTPGALAFEVFRRTHLPWDETACDDTVVVLWVSTAAVPGGEMLDQMNHLFGVAQSLVEKARFKGTIIGPYASDDLLAMARSALRGKAGDWPNLKDVPIRTASATISPAQVAAANPCPCPDWEANVGFTRAIADDSVLARLLVKELSLHSATGGDAAPARIREKREPGEPTPVNRPDASERVLVVYERDTSYARRLVTELKGRLGERLESIGYLRGLDGEVPRVATDKGAAEPGKPGAGSRWYEYPVGEYQFDYLRRLVEQVKRRERGGARQPFTAIGLVGSDPYDKILVLQAMRRSFPGVLFFTTDLDARLLDPAEYPQTRNLVIASGFDLELGPTLQGRVPTFRDCYQTALFLCTLESAGNPDAAAASEAVRNRAPARVYEIARNGFYPLTQAAPPGVYPQPWSGLFWWAKEGYKLAWALMLLFTLVAFVAGSLRLMRPSAPTDKVLPLWAERRLPTRWAKRWARIESEPWVDIALIFLLCVGVTALGVILFEWCRKQSSDGEPMLLFEGISVWPSVMLRWAAACLALFYVYHLSVMWSERSRAISRDYFELQTGVIPWRQWRWQVLKWRRESAQPDAQQVWKVYVELERLVPRLLRTTILTAGYFFFGYLVWSGLYYPASPARGAIASSANFTSIMFSILAINFLNFFVWDSARLCRALISHLSGEPTKYPPQTTLKMKEKEGMPAAAVGSVLDMRIIGDCTTIASRAIYFPFVVLFIFIAARNDRFDNWQWSVPLVITLGISFAVSVHSVYLLRDAANKARAEEVKHIRKQIGIALAAAAEAAAVPGDRPDLEPEVTRLERALEEVQGYQRGAFAALRDNPIVRAVLIPLGGLLSIKGLELIATQL